MDLLLDIVVYTIIAVGIIGGMWILFDSFKEDYDAKRNQTHRLKHTTLYCAWLSKRLKRRLVENKPTAEELEVMRRRIG